MDVRDEPLQEPSVVTVTLPGVVSQVQAGEAEPVIEAGWQHAGQVAEATRGEVKATQPPTEAGVQSGQGPGLGVKPVEAGVMAQPQVLEVRNGLECVFLNCGQNFVITEAVKMNSLITIKLILLCQHVTVTYLKNPLEGLPYGNVS